MALTLKADITATQTTIDVNGTDALSNGDLCAIEDEQVFISTALTGSVQPGETPWQRLGVARGSLGTTEVAHAAGTAMTRVSTPLGSGAVQTITRIGPITVNHDDAGLDGNPGVKVADLAPGDVVISASCHVVTAFPAGVQMQFAIGPADWATGNYWIIEKVFADVANLGDGLSGAFAKRSGSIVDPTIIDSSMVDPSTIELTAGGYMDDTSGALIAIVPGGAGNRATGQVKVYALIASPA